MQNSHSSKYVGRKVYRRLSLKNDSFSKSHGKKLVLQNRKVSHMFFKVAVRVFDCFSMVINIVKSPVMLNYFHQTVGDVLIVNFSLYY